jgi:hypothetical protein
LRPFDAHPGRPLPTGYASRPAVQWGEAGRDDEGQPAQAINSACRKVRPATRVFYGTIEVAQTRHNGLRPERHVTTQPSPERGS